MDILRNPCLGVVVITIFLSFEKNDSYASQNLGLNDFILSQFFLYESRSSFSNPTLNILQTNLI